MASIGRNNKRGGGGGGTGQGAGAAPRRSSWRGGPPGSSPGGANGPGRQSQAQKQDSAPNGSSFRTDADISHASGPVQRELQPWGGAAATAASPSATNGAAKDAETFGEMAGGAITGAWDQFAVNERLTGAKTDFDEELYTTKLNRGGADYRKREKEAERLAKEIMTGTTSNPHIAEERNQVDDSGKDEEDKYSGVIRAPNAYVPPGARRSQIAPGIVQVGSPPSAPKAPAVVNGAPTPLDVLAAGLTMARSTSNAPQSTEKADVPKMSVEEHDVAEKTKEQPMKAAVVEFKAFIGTERERYDARKQSMAKTERTRQFAELVKFGQSFKVTHPLPKDILPILTKDEQKQKDIEARAKEASLAKASPSNAPSTTASAAASPQQPKKIAMKIQEIPAFGGAKKAVKPPTIPVEGSATQNIPQPVTSPTPSAASIAAAKLNPKASSFVFKPSAASFTPKTAEQSAAGPSTRTTGSVAAASPAPSAAQPAAAAPPINPFFHGQPIRRTNGLNVRDDFNPWKHNKLAEASSIAPTWPYSGKRFMNMFPPVTAMHPQPGSFEEESMMGGPMPPNGGPNFNPGYPYQPYRFGGQPGMMQHMPMPGNGPYPPQYPGGMQGPNGPGPMFYNPGMPQGPQYMGGPPGQFSPNGPNRPGPGPGPGGQPGPGPQMYYAMQSPQLNHSPFPPQQQQPPPSFQPGPPPTPPQTQPSV